MKPIKQYVARTTAFALLWGLCTMMYMSITVVARMHRTLLELLWGGGIGAVTIWGLICILFWIVKNWDDGL